MVEIYGKKHSFQPDVLDNYGILISQLSYVYVYIMIKDGARENVDVTSEETDLWSFFTLIKCYVLLEIIKKTKKKT